MRRYHRIRVVNLNLYFLEDVGIRVCVYVDYVYDFVCMWIF